MPLPSRRPDAIPLPRPRPRMVAPPPWVATGWSKPKTFREAAGEDFKTAEVTSEMSPCRARLEKFAVIVAMPRLIGPGSCGGTDIVRLDAVLIAGGKQCRDQAGAVSAMPDGRRQFARGCATTTRRRRSPPAPG